MNIDRKYRILAINPTTGHAHNQNDSILFLAKDLAVVPMLQEYYVQCRKLGCDAHHLKSVDLLINRVKAFQLNESKVPDTTPEENTVHDGE